MRNSLLCKTAKAAVRAGCRLSVERLEDRCLPSTLQAISVPDPHQPPSDTAAGASALDAVSADGRYVVFESTAPNLVPGQAGSPFVNNIFLLDRSTGVTTLVSHVPGSATTTPTAQLDIAPYLDDSYGALISRDGRFILYTTAAAGQLVGAGSDPQAVLYDRLTGLNTLVSHPSGSPMTPVPGVAFAEAMSGDGRYLVFEGPSSGVVANEVATTTNQQLYLYDRVAGTTVLVTHKDGLPATTADTGAALGEASVADDGTVAYSSNASNLVGSSSRGFNVYLYTPATQTNQKITIDDISVINGSTEAVISGDGSAVAYVSTANGLVRNVFRYDRHTGTTILVSGAGGSAGVGGNADSGGRALGSIALSHDGRFLAFASQATNLLPGQSGAAGNVFLYDAAADTLTLLSGANNSPLAGAGGTGGDGNSPPALEVRYPNSHFVTMSDDGGLVAYLSRAGNIVPGQAGPAGVYNVFLYSRATGLNALVSGAGGSPTAGGGDDSGSVALSGDGNLLGFTTRAIGLINGVFDANGVADVLTYTPGSSGSALVSRSAFVLAKHGGDSFATSVSGDGRYTVFTSNATNLVDDQSTLNSHYNIFLFDKATQTTTLVNHVPGFANTTGDGGLGSDSGNASRPPRYLLPVISADGNYIAFVSYDDNLVAGETRGPTFGWLFIYLYDRRADQVRLIGGPNTAGFFSNGYYWDPVISADGRYVAYAYGTPPEGTNPFGAGSVALYDSVLGTTTHVSPDTAFGTANTPTLSDDGRFVAYEDSGNVYLFDQASGSNTLVSHASDSPTAAANGNSSKPVISHDGSAIAFVSQATNLVPGQVAIPFTNVFLYSVATGTVRLVSGVNGSAIVGGDGNADSPAIGLDGGYVAFRSDASNLMLGQSGSRGNIFEFNRQAGTQTLVSHQAGTPSAGAGGSSEPVLDDDGHFVSYISTAGNLVVGQAGTAGVQNVFVWQRQANANILASGQDGSPAVTGNADSDAPLLTRHSFPGFSSKATNLVAGLGGTSVAYINTLVQLLLSPNTVADGSPAGTVVGTVTIVSQLVGQFSPPVFTLPGGEADNGFFSLTAGQDSGTLTIRFQANYAARQSYEVNVHVDFGLGDDFGALDVVVAAPPPLVAPLDPLIAAAQGFAQSREHYTQFVVRAYQQYLKRFPDPSGLEFWVSSMLGGVYTDERVESFFIGSDEYIANHGGPGAAWVTGMYQDLLGRTPADAEVQSWVNVLNAGTPADAVALGFAASTEREIQRVTSNYWTYLNRRPSAAEVDLWVNGFLHGLTNEGMVAGFVGSPEYYNDPAKGAGDAATWVRRAYLDVLFRAASDDEVAGWLRFLG
jgi:Tol biopolymer transport system component